MTTSQDYEADYREAQAAGHHVDCDGYRIVHRVTIERERTSSTAAPWLYRAVCNDCGALHVGSFGSESTAEHAGAGHAHSARCDGRCRDW